MSLEAWEDEAEFETKDSGKLDWSKKYLSEAYLNAPKSFLEEYCKQYEIEKKRIFNLNLEGFRNDLYILSDNFYNLLSMDWMNIVYGLLSERNIKIFDFIYFLSTKSILPSDLANNYCFHEYQELLEDEVFIKDTSKNVELNGRLKIITTDSENWERITEKKSYIIKLDVATYVRSHEKKSINTINTSEEIIVLDGFEYKSPLTIDELIYLEV